MMTANQRSALLAGLAAIHAAHGHNPHRHGMEAFQALRHFRVTWPDLFGPVMAAEPCFREASDLAEARAILAAELARGVHRVMFLATPAQLATAAAILCRPDWNEPPGDTDRDLGRVGKMVEQLDWQAFQQGLDPHFQGSAA